MAYAVHTPSSAVADEAATSPSGTLVRLFVRQLAWFVVVGATSTGINAAIYLLLRQWWGLVTATVVALALSTVASSEANRLLTFAGSATTRSSLNTQSVLVFLFYCCYGTLTLGALHLAVPDATPEAEAIALSVASTLGGVGRFLLLRLWVFADLPAGRPRDRCDSRPRPARAPRGVRPQHRHARRADVDQSNPTTSPAPATTFRARISAGPRMAPDRPAAGAAGSQP